MPHRGLKLPARVVACLTACPSLLYALGCSFVCMLMALKLTSAHVQARVALLHMSLWVYRIAAQALPICWSSLADCAQISASWLVKYRCQPLLCLWYVWCITLVVSSQILQQHAQAFGQRHRWSGSNSVHGMMRPLEGMWQLLCRRSLGGQ